MTLVARAGCARHVITPEAGGIVHIRILGMWIEADVDRFFAELTTVHRRARIQHGAMRALIEVEAVQSPLVVLHVRKRAVALKDEGDRNAVLVATMLSKLQIKRLGGTDSFAVFTDEHAAREWLLS